MSPAGATGADRSRSGGKEPAPSLGNRVGEAGRGLGEGSVRSERCRRSIPDRSRRRFPTALAAVLLVALATPDPGRAELAVSALFGDGMVLQRETTVPVRGRAAPGATVRVTFRGGIAEGRVDAAGAWTAPVPTGEAGGPFELAVAVGDEEIRLRDVLVGDVWLCSGQSNMEWPLELADGAEAVLAGPADPGIRHFGVPRAWSWHPVAEVPGGAWEPADTEHVGGFTAVGTFFARALRPHVGVPVGLLHASWGGSRIEPWTSAEALGLDAEDRRALRLRDAAVERKIREELRRRIGELPERDAGLVDGEAAWAAFDLDDSGWEQIPVPAAWEAVGYPGLDGSAWYRTSFELSAAEAAGAVRLGVGEIDDSDVTYLNGTPVGAMELAWAVPRVYDAPAGVARPGRNVLAVRVLDTGGGGGIQGTPDQLWLETAAGRRSLAGDWRFAVGEVTIDLEFLRNQVPTVLYNAMIHPLNDFPVRGVLWYQGESNAGPGDASAYRELLAGLIGDWRRRRNRPELPFLVVQLAGFLPLGEEPEESSWAVLREAQAAAALALPATALVVLTDVGDPHDVHPTDKETVGRRLALAARRVAYGEDVVHSGPTYREHEVLEDGRVRIAWDHVGDGLAVRGGPEAPLAGFEVAGMDLAFVPAEAEIDGEAVLVGSGRVPDPVAVRYAWADDPGAANLVNSAGLPAAPFRTRSW